MTAPPFMEETLIYTSDGFVSVLLTTRGRPNLGGNGLTDLTPDECMALAGKFLAYCGTYEVDEALSLVTHRLLVAFAPNMVGSAQERLVQIDGDVLCLTERHSNAPNSTGVESRLEWARVNPVRSEKD